MFYSTCILVSRLLASDFIQLALSFYQLSLGSRLLALGLHQLALDSRLLAFAFNQLALGSRLLAFGFIQLARKVLPNLL